MSSRNRSFPDQIEVPFFAEIGIARNSQLVTLEFVATAHFDGGELEVDNIRVRRLDGRTGKYETYPADWALEEPWITQVYEAVRDWLDQEAERQAEFGYAHDDEDYARYG